MTSSLSSDVLGSLLDELEKIAADDRAKKAKRWLKNTAIVAAGTGMGTAAMMATERVLTTALGPHWAKLTPSTQKMILVPAMGLTSAGASLALKKLLDERKRTESE